MSEKGIYNLSPLTDEDIAKQNIDLFDLWMLKDESGQLYGPFDTETLKNESREQFDEFEPIEAYNLATEKWSPFFKVTQFQRRKPKLVPMQSLKTVDEFYLLVQGVKKGPFTLGEVKGLVKEKKIPLNIQTSIDKGESWIKLFEHHEFDRRLLKNKEDLPFSPNQDVFENETKNLKSYLEKNKKEHDEQDAIIGLAFIGQGNDKGQKIKSKSSVTTDEVSHPQMDERNEKPNKKFSLNWKISIGAVAGIFMFFTVLNSFNSSFKTEINADSQIKSFVQKPTPKVNTAPVVERKPAQAIKAKKFKPVEKKERRYIPKTAPRAKKYRQVHTDKRYETIDLDDPYVKEELTRDLAGDYGNEELSPEEIDFIEKADREGLSEEDLERLERYEENRYHEVEAFE